MTPLELAQIIAKKKIQNNPSILEKIPWAQAGISAVLNGDAKAGTEIANNICQSYGSTPEQIIGAYNNGEIRLDL